MNVKSKSYDVNDLAFLKTLEVGAPELGMALRLQGMAMVMSYKNEKKMDLLQDFLSTPEGRDKLARALGPVIQEKLEVHSFVLRSSNVSYSDGMADRVQCKLGDYFFSSVRERDHWKITVGQLVASEAIISQINYGSTISIPKNLEGVDLDVVLALGVTDLIDTENSLLTKVLLKYADKQSQLSAGRVWSGNTAPTAVKILSSRLDQDGKSVFKYIYCGQAVFEKLKKITFGFDEVTDPRLGELPLRGSLFGIPIFVHQAFDRRAYFFPDLIGKVFQKKEYIKVVSVYNDLPFNSPDSYDFKIHREINVTMNPNGVEVLIPQDDELADVKPVRFNRFNALTMKGFF